jgi:hypothetical protein
MKINIFFLLLLLGSTNIFAQKDKDLPTESVEVVKEFDARLLETNKISVTPLLPALDTFTKRQDYNIPPKPLAVKYDAPKLRPIGMKTGAKEKIYNGWVKAGAGVPTSLFGEAGYYFGKKDKFDAKFWARHHSANFKSLENQRFMNNDFLLNGNMYLNKNTAVEAKIGYSYDRVHFYGYDHKVDTFSKERVRQDFKIPEIGFRIYNSERTSNDLNYSIEPKFYVLNDYYSNKETGFDLNMSATKWFAEKHPFRMNIRTDFTTYEDTAKQKLNNIYLQPSFTFHANFMKLKIGGNFASNRDVFSIFPDAELNLRIWGDGIQLFAGALGDLRKNTYRSISKYNPFIQMRGSNIDNTKYYNYYGGLKGNLGFLEYSAQGGYSTASNLALFQTLFETDEPTRFKVLYDSAKIVNLQGSIKLVPIKNLTVTGTLSQNIYKMAKESNAWGLPGLEGNFTGKYTLLDNKVAVKTEIYIADKIERLAADGTSGKDGALVDVSLGGSYMVAKNFGVFLDINNILNNKRQRWHNYPNYGTNILVGVQAKF